MQNKDVSRPLIKMHPGPLEKTSANAKWIAVCVRNNDNFAMGNKKRITGVAFKNLIVQHGARTLMSALSEYLEGFL